ncbi:Pumilio -like protein 23 [Capsicum baccatum]|uniref:Pumilio-like protein 23 n=1 Tax=Capsicum baccatum TaxID=33114 RepID=A0A2G2WL06_CAPBA|nr:Pumilio -like protein 23 [Capsicum baccatum]
MGRKTSKKHAGVNVDHTIESVSGGNVDDNGRPRKDNKTTPVQQTSFVRNSLFLMSSHHCANFVMQALASQAKSQDHELVQVYVTSITSLEEHHVLEASKDSSGSWVIESFLNSNISAKQKRKLVAKLQGHFGELSVHPFGSFTVEKCFTASNLNLRETLVSEMLPLQAELSKTKQGPFPLRKLDIDGYARQPDQWKSR